MLCIVLHRFARQVNSIASMLDARETFGSPESLDDFGSPKSANSSR